MHKLFYYAIAIIVLASNTDLVRAAAYYFSGSVNVEEAFAFMQSSTLVDRLYMLVGNAFNYASVFFCWILFRKREYLPKFCSLWAGLSASALYFFVSTWDLWVPIAQGASMSDGFAMGFVKITLYANIIGLLSCMLGLAVGKQLQTKQNAR
ncbi:MAG: hypothetical protein ACJAVV_001325 [Alphaproteobacteria bacterium]